MGDNTGRNPLEKPLTLEELRAVVKPFATPSNARGFFEVSITLVLFFSSLLFAGYVKNYSTLLALCLSIPSGLLLMRIFVLHHDCGHRSLFVAPWLNLWVGRLLALPALTPFDYWRRIHHRHHQNTGKLDALRGDGEVWLYTVEEYATLGFWKKLQYRLYHFPPILFCVGPIYLFMLHYRFWWKAEESRDRRSMLAYNVALFVAIACSLFFVTPEQLLVVYAPAVAVAAIVGVWLFYIQHVFEQAYFAHDTGEHPYNRRDAFVRGSSFYKLPRLLDWVTAGIGYHSIHHVNPSVPSYRLRKCWEATKEFFDETPCFTLRESFKQIGFGLWSTKEQKMVRFS